MSSYVGIDLSTHFVDLVRLDEESDRAETALAGSPAEKEQPTTIDVPAETIQAIAERARLDYGCVMCGSRNIELRTLGTNDTHCRDCGHVQHWSMR